jgi:hypothetical protein
VPDTTVPAVKSPLKRARATLEEAAPSIGHVIEPSDPQARDFLSRYTEAFEESDEAALQKILRADIALEATSAGARFDGMATCVLGAPGRRWPATTAGSGRLTAARCARKGRLSRARAQVRPTLRVTINPRSWSRVVISACDSRWHGQQRRRRGRGRR